MDPQRFSGFMRRLASLAGSVLLLLFVGAVVTRAPARREVPSLPYRLRASGLAAQTGATNPLLAGGSGISGPYLATAKAASFNGDVRKLPQIKPGVKETKPELQANENARSSRATVVDSAIQAPAGPSRPSQPMPPTLQNFAGLNFETVGTGYPPDTNGDVGPNDYVQTVNTGIGIFDKSGNQLAAFYFDSLFSAAGTGTACDSANNGDPVTLYNPLYDRWIVADFSWANIDDGPYFECIAASKTGDPLNGGWYLYGFRADDDAHKWLNDYPKLGVWLDGIYMSANMFDCTGGCTSAAFEGARVWAINPTDLFGGSPLTSVFFDTGGSYFSLLPSNLRGPVPPPGTPNYFVSNDGGLSALDVFKFHVDWINLLNSTFSGPTQVAEASYNAPPDTVPEPAGGNALDSLGDRLMMQNQYRNLAGTESLWIAHTADNPTAIRWYQLNVSGGTVATSPVQQGTYSPDSTNRWMPSLAVDKFGDMAVGYSTVSASQFADIRYAGRLVTDTLGTLGQSESILVSGGGVQNNSCGTGVCIRWGDYSAMTVDPVDDCTFWYTTEYYPSSGDNWQTRIGSFRFPACGSEPAVIPRLYVPVVAQTSAPAAWSTIMQESFEGAWPNTGWVVTDPGFGEYYWAKSNCRAASGSSSAWAMGGGSIGSGLACGAQYINDAFSWMVYGPFSLANATAADLQAQLWVNSEGSADPVCLMASNNDSTFDTSIAGTCFSGSSGGSFVPETLDLSHIFQQGSLLGQPNVWIAVIFQSNGSVTYPEGAYVDDLLLRECTGGTCSAQARAATMSQLHAAKATLTRPSNVGPARSRP